jgi:hypothetical protein
VVPAGRPESVTDTEPENPFSAVIEAVKFEFDIPAFTAMATGDRAILNAGTVLTVSASGAECVKDPDVPVAVTA